MPVDATWRIQANSGTSSVTTSGTNFTVSLLNPTQPGSALLLFITSQGVSVNNFATGFDPPFVFDIQSAPRYWCRRSNQPAGETSWNFTGTATTAQTVAWRAEEWSGLSSVANPDATNIPVTSPAFAQNLGVQANTFQGSSGTGNSPVPDVADFAALAMVAAGAGTGVYPAGRSWSSPWSEVDAITVGTGTATGDVMLLVAECYPQATGTLDCTMTWDITGGGTYADKTVYVGGACYQPSVPVAVAVVLTP